MTRSRGGRPPTVEQARQAEDLNGIQKQCAGGVPASDSWRASIVFPHAPSHRYRPTAQAPWSPAPPTPSARPNRPVSGTTGQSAFVGAAPNNSSDSIRTSTSFATPYRLSGVDKEEDSRQQRGGEAQDRSDDRKLGLREPTIAVASNPTPDHVVEHLGTLLGVDS
jgi:hypothetical protein